jgi:Peptidase family M1 domain
VNPMKVQPRRIVPILLVFCALALVTQIASAQTPGAESFAGQSNSQPSKQSQNSVPAAGSAHALYDTLNALRVNAHEVYSIKNFDLRRDILHITFAEGRLAFLETFQGKITGAVFSGHGHVLAVPREPSEKESLARFVGTPVLDEDISNTYLRFDDDTAAELQSKLKAAGDLPTEDSSISDEWNPVVAVLNRWHSLRLLNDILASQTVPYFYAGMEGSQSGPFDVLIDDRRDEQVMIGQPKTAGGQPVFDSWVSATRANAPKPLPPAFEPVSYSLDTTILPDLDLEGTANITLKCGRDGERILPLQLSSMLRVESVADASGHALEFFQSDPTRRQEIATLGNDALFVILNDPPHASDSVRLRVTYQGRVIADAGNGVFFVGERGSWYPHGVGGTQFSTFDMHFRWPHQWQLVATGNKISETEASEWREGQWRTDMPYRFVGFNLGNYHQASVDTPAIHVDLYANAQLEQALQQRLRSTEITTSPVPSSDGRGTYGGVSALPIIPPSPTAQLTKLGEEIAQAAQFFTQFGGPFPFKRLAVSQAPGGSGQGWPGLIYLPTLSFLSPEGQSSVGVSTQGQQHFTDVVPYHEVAHQWWGNLVSWDSYRDQWISEGLANYTALMFIESRKSTQHELTNWMERYRTALLVRVEGKDTRIDETGSLSLGFRLRSSINPNGYEELIYPKSTWVFHMLREMLRDPHSPEPDAKFAGLLRSLIEAYREAPLSTEKLQRAVEHVMTPAMDLEGDHSMSWFFDEYVRSTGIPRYKVDFTVEPQGDHFIVKGTLHQTEVPTRFVENVPLYATRAGGKSVYLGHVSTNGPNTRFQFRAAFAPHHIAIDPELTLLCQPN